MEIIKVVALAFVALFLIITFKDRRDDITLLIGIGAGVMIFLFMLSKINAILLFLQDMAFKANLDTIYLNTVIKIIGIAYLTSFCSELCKDAGANSIASKVEFSGKILILFLAIPILMAVLDTIMSIM